MIISQLKERDGTCEKFVSGKNQHYNLGANSIINPQVSPSVKVSTEITSHAQKEKVDSIQDANFAVDLTDSKFTPGEMFCELGCQACVPISWTCNKQTAVSHRSTEAEVISLDTVSRTEGITCVNIVGFCD